MLVIPKPIQDKRKITSASPVERKANTPLLRRILPYWYAAFSNKLDLDNDRQATATIGAKPAGDIIYIAGSAGDGSDLFVVSSTF